MYTADISWEISTGQELTVRWEAGLSMDQKVYLLVLRSMVLPQLLLRTKDRKELADRTAINCLQRANRVNKKGKVEEN